MDQKWLYRTFDNVLRRCREKSKPCHCIQASESNDYILGFVNTNVFHRWLRNNGNQPIWIKIEDDGGEKPPQRHALLALCILRQAIRSEVAEGGSIFTYSHLDASGIVLPEAYLAEKANMLGRKRARIDAVEALLLSIFMQLKNKGGLVEDDDLVHQSRPDRLIKSLIPAIKSALRKMHDPVYFVLNDLHKGDDTEDGLIDRVLGVMSTILETDAVGYKRWCIISARKTPYTSEHLGAFPSVSPRSEFEGNIPL